MRKFSQTQKQSGIGGFELETPSLSVRILFVGMPFLFTTIVSTILSGLMLWLVARWYRYWLRIAEILRVLLLGIFASVMLVALLWFFDELQSELPQLLAHFGAVGPVAVAILVAIAVWA